mgnify:CR=1 FL=1
MSKILFFSGAGLSADSGLGVFRGGKGLWDHYDVNKVCNIHTWESNYKMVHEFYSLRRKEYGKAQPNSMHKLIADLQQKYGSQRVIVITQNIDNLLEVAGCSDVMHVHGHINYIHCTACGHEVYINDDYKDMTCEKCGQNHFKPSIVFFGEQAPQYYHMFKSFDLLDENDGVAVIGTEGSVVPIANILGTKQNGVKAKRLLCNLERSMYINDMLFDEVIYERAELSCQNVLDFATSILEK